MLVGLVALDLDRAQHVAVALGDRQMQAELRRHELLELLADRSDQWAVRAECFGIARGRRARFPNACMLGSSASVEGAFAPLSGAVARDRTFSRRFALFTIQLLSFMALLLPMRGIGA